VKPRARTDGLVVRDLPGEIVVYDLGSHRAHCLNRTAAFVFRHADGRRTVADLAVALAEDAGAAADETVVHLTLDRLAEAGLLASGPVQEPPGGLSPAEASRRDAIRRVGLGAAVLLPIVTSLLVPTPAEAASPACIPFSSCTNATLQEPCYVDNPEAQCPTLKCQGPGFCN
jgi:hypothetical protein